MIIINELPRTYISQVDKNYITTYALSILANEQLLSSKYAVDAIKKYNIDAEKPMPTKV